MVVIRNLQKGDLDFVFEILHDAYGRLESNEWFEETKRTIGSPSYDTRGFFIAEADKTPLGCVGIVARPSQRHVEINYLAVRDAFRNEEVIDLLIKSALEFGSLPNVSFRASTLTIDPYVGAYIRHGFVPERRMLQIGWDLASISATSSEAALKIHELDSERVEEASLVWAGGLKPYWDWWIEEEGGTNAVRKDFVDSIRDHHLPGFAMIKDDCIVATTMLFRLTWIEGEAQFSGIAMLPEYRLRGLGKEFMLAVLSKARQMGYKRLCMPFTVAYLDRLAPGAVLYLKTGGKIEVERLHLVHASNPTSA